MLITPTVNLVQLLHVDSPISFPQSGSECPCSGLVRFGEGDRWVGKLSLKRLNRKQPWLPPCYHRSYTDINIYINALPPAYTLITDVTATRAESMDCG